MPFVYDFDHEHRRPPMEMKDLLGGKGANLAEMTSVLGLRSRRGSPSPPRLPGLHGGAAGRRADRRGGRARARLEKKMGKRIGDPADPLLVSVRSGAKFSMPGMMDTVLNLGLNDQSVEGLAKQTDDERFAYDSYRRFVAMYGRIVLGIPGEEFDALLDAAKELAGHRRRTPGSPPSCCATWSTPTSRSSSATPARPSPRIPTSSCAGRSRRSSPRGTARGPSPTGYRERIAHDLGTAVNVQAMVFGNRDDRSGTGVGFTRDPATGAKGEYGDFLVNAQGEDVVAGIRNTEPLSALKDQFPDDPHRAAGHLRPARAPLPRHVRHRVHHRAGQALDAADPGGQAHRPGRAADGRRHDHRPGRSR